MQSEPVSHISITKSNSTGDVRVALWCRVTFSDECSAHMDGNRARSSVFAIGTGWGFFRFFLSTSISFSERQSDLDKKKRLLTKEKNKNK